MSRQLPVVDNRSCFTIMHETSTECDRASCQNWVSMPEALNCSIIGARSDKMTLHAIGRIYGVSRMKICQIEKEALAKVKEALVSCVHELET